VARDDHDAEVHRRHPFPDAGGELQSVQAWHVQVDDRQVEVSCPEQAQRVAAVVDFFDDVDVQIGLETGADQSSHVQIVVGDEHSPGGAHGPARRGEPVEDVEDRGGTLGGILGERRRQNGVDFFGQVGPPIGRSGRRLVQVLGVEAPDVRRPKRGLARQELMGQRSEGVDIDAWQELGACLPGDALGRDVRRCAEQLVAPVGDPEVRHPRAAFDVEQDIPRLEIAVHCAVLVDRRHARCDALQKPQRLVDGDGLVVPAGVILRQRRAVDVLHREVRALVVLAEGEDLDDVRVADLSHGSGLRQEGRARLLAPEQVRMHQFGRDVSLERLVVNPQNDPHAPTAQRSDDAQAWREQGPRRRSVGAVGRLAHLPKIAWLARGRGRSMTAPMVSEIFDPSRWEPVPGFENLTDLTYHRAKEHGTVRVAFNRPEVRNAFRPRTVDELFRALDHARRTSDVGCVLLTGNGPSPKDGGWAFCSGGDQRIRGKDGYQYEGDDGADPARLGRLHILEVQRLIRFMPKVVICVVPGWAVGGGHSLHVVCDLTLASERARFKQTDADVASYDAGYGSAYLARMVGQKKAREIFFLGATYTAQEAAAMGMVNAVVPHEQLESVALDWAKEIVHKSPTAIRMLKFAMNMIDDGLVGQQIFAGEATRLGYMTDEAREGRDAFLEKREKDFSKFPWYY